VSGKSRKKSFKKNKVPKHKESIGEVIDQVTQLFIANKSLIILFFQTIMSVIFSLRFSAFHTLSLVKYLEATVH
jgi:hypothetical protein